jgi:hypothetical protein
MRKEETNQACAELFRVQYCLIHRLQALTRGLTDKMIRARVDARLWEEVLPGVYRLAGAPSSWRQSLKAIELWAGPGSAISHRAAAALYGLDGSPPGTAELTMRRTTKTPLADVIVHYSNRLRDVDIVEHQGIAVTSLPRTLLDLGAVQRPWRVCAATDHALRDRRITEEELLEHLADLGGKGCRGTGAIRTYLKDLTVLGSVLERRTAGMLTRFSVPKPETQYELFDVEGLIGALDFAWPPIRLGLEADGYKPHSGRQSFYDGRTKMNRAAGIGWTILRCTWWDIEHPSRLIRIVNSFFPS